MTQPLGVVRRPRGESLRILLDAGASDGALGAVEMTLHAGSTGPPLHVHPTHAEAFYVLAGELSVQLGDEVITGGPGTWACAPRGVAHTLANLGSAEVRVLCLFAPGGFERRFERMLADASGSEGESLAVLSVAERRTQVIGPPLSQ